MTDDLLSFSQVDPSGVGGQPAVPDLLATAGPVPPPIDPRTKKVRRRPNNGRPKRTDRTPGLSEPPWEILRSLNIYLPPTLECLPYTPPNWRRGYPYLVWKSRVFEMWGHVCHLCGHDGAYSADHLVPLSVWSNQPYDPYLARPAHGVKQPDGSEGCPVCYVKCNSSRGNRALANQIANYQGAIRL